MADTDTNIRMPRDEFNKMVGRRIQEARIKAGWKQAPAFARHIGIKPENYYKYESGANSLSLENAWIIADGLEMPLDDLIGRDVAKKLVISDDLDPMERHVLQRFRDLDPEDKIKAYNEIEYFIVNLGEGGPEEKESE